MKSKAFLRYLKIAPRKVRLVADLVRGKKAQEAQQILKFTPNKSCLPMLKLLNSAIASAKQNFSADETNLYISKLLVNEGPKLKRFRPRARGQAYEIQKKTSHVAMELSELVEGKRVAPQEHIVATENVEKEVSKQEKPKFDITKEGRKQPSVVRAAQRIFRRKAI